MKKANNTSKGEIWRIYTDLGGGTNDLLVANQQPCSKCWALGSIDCSNFTEALDLANKFRDLPSYSDSKIILPPLSSGHCGCDGANQEYKS